MAADPFRMQEIGRDAEGARDYARDVAARAALEAGRVYDAALPPTSAR